MYWIIWNTAEPQTTKTNNPSSQGPTGFLLSSCFWIRNVIVKEQVVYIVVYIFTSPLLTFPLCVMFLLAFSLAILILCWADILAVFSWILTTFWTKNVHF